MRNPLRSKAPENPTYEFIGDLAEASIKRKRLDEKGRLSYPAGQGLCAVMFSVMPDFNSNIHPDEQARNMTEYAERVTADRQAQNDLGAVMWRATPRNFRSVLRKEHVSDIVTVSNLGNIGEIKSDEYQTVTWQDVSRMSRYLLRGRFEQLHDGVFPAKPVAALGSFALYDQRKLLCAPNVVFPGYDHGDSLRLTSIYSGAKPLVEEVMEANLIWSGVQPIDLRPFLPKADSEAAFRSRRTLHPTS